MTKEKKPAETKDIVEVIPEEILDIKSDEVEADLKAISKEPREEKLSSWSPKTKLGKLVKEGKEKDIDNLLRAHKKILEPEIIDFMVNLETDLISVGQSKGKFGGGKRRAWKQTQKKTMEGNVVSFSAMAIAGDKKSHIGLGFGKARETLPARDKAIRNAKLNLTKINLGFESPENESPDSKPHTIPFKVEGKSGSVRITLWPAPRGTGLVTGDQCKKILRLAGIEDIYSNTRGKTKTASNLAKACISALIKTNATLK